MQKLSHSQDKQTEVSAAPRKAAMYVRMSDEHQKYSIANQTATITSYAEKHNIEIVTQYADGAKSGLNIKGRKQLRKLIDDVVNRRADFSVILVLDVTRWGRFQQLDESAHYEYVCRSAGVRIEYVDEQFGNSDSIQDALMKTMKRGMSASYSSELSKKVFIGQCRLIGMGFRQGGHAGYGLRRMMINEHREPKCILAYGDQKGLLTDRVILVPGPQEEVDNVRWMYRAFTEEGLQEGAIAVLLNQRGVLTDLGRAWTRGTVHQVLTNEKYIGNNVYNRNSFKLKDIHVKNTPDKWIRSDGAFEAIVEPSHFYTAQGIIRERSRKLSNDDMLGKLRKLCERQGWLSGITIDETEDMPSSSAYSHRFGSLIQAYQLIGYTPRRDYRYIEINRHLRKLHSGIINDTIEKIKALGGNVQQESPSELLIVNEELRVSVIICRCVQTATGKHRWRMHLDTGYEPDITLAIRMDANNQQPLDYYLLPALDIENPRMTWPCHPAMLRKT